MVAENKIRPDTKALDLSETLRQATDKFFTTLSAEFFVKMDQQQGIHAERFDGSQLLRQRINQRRHMIRSDHGVWMPIEGKHEREGVVLARVGNSLPDDLLVSQMDAVKETNGQTHFAAGGLQFICRV